MSDEIQVRSGLSVKVTNPSNQYENSTFSKSITRTRSVAPPPEDLDKMETYEAYLDQIENELEAKVSKKVEELIQAEIDQFYADNGV